MHRPRKDSLPTILTPISVFGCLCVLCLFVPLLFADDLGLANPAEKDFSEIKTGTQKNSNFARKSSAFNERSLPSPEKSEAIRQVSANEDDPFPVLSQPLVAQSSPAFDLGFPAQAAPNHPLLAQNNVVPYDPYAGSQYMYPAGMDTGYFAQFAQVQQYQPEYVNPYAMGNVYPQYGYVADPYGMSNYPMDYQTGYQEMPDYSAFYQALMLQEMARQQAGGSQEQTNNGKNVDDAKKQADAAWTLNNLMPVRVTSPLGETLLVCAKTVSPFSSPTGPDKGVGMPLVNKSWLDHPWYFGGFVGSMSGSELVSGMIDQKTGGHGGFIYGYNFNEYWGLESRLHLASIDIHDTDNAKQIFADAWTLSNPDMPVPTLTTRTNELTVLDAAVHYYPLGNAKWRPYVKYGLGFGRQKYVNTFGFEQSSDVITMPLGVGVRYWWNERIAIQADLIDDVIFSSNISKTQNNVAFTVGLTFSFGSGKKKHPVHYWPATPSMGSKW